LDFLLPRFLTLWDEDFKRDGSQEVDHEVAGFEVCPCYSLLIGDLQVCLRVDERCPETEEDIQKEQNINYSVNYIFTE
jgi:hypothetical protein